MSLHAIDTGDTEFAPAARADEATLRRQRASFLSDPMAVSMLEAMPGPSMVLNAQRQVLALNGQLVRLLGSGAIEALVGQRVGDLMRCVQADRTPGGCGTTAACSACGAAQAIVECLATRARTTRECRIRTRGEEDGGAREFQVHASYVVFGDEGLVVLGLQDTSGENRRRVLERVFFHDLLNTAGGMQGLAELLADEALEPAMEHECKQDLQRLTRAVVEEIESHREMLAAERGELRARFEDADVALLTRQVAELYRHLPAGAGREVEVRTAGAVPLRTDPTLLRRVLGNLAKNALEASQPGETVTLACEGGAAAVTFSVHNRGVMPMEVQHQVFQRSFSTKGGTGRGLGTYSVRLLTERHLGGHVGFVSNAENGTTFLVTLPVLPPAH